MALASTCWMFDHVRRFASRFVPLSLVAVHTFEVMFLKSLVKAPKNCLSVMVKT